MKDRTLQILAALIEDFIETASPVASQKLLMSHEFKVSSATVRNEFALLEEVGLIKSPHVSAGKVPTQKGYRFFVDELLQEDKAEALVHSIFQKHIEEYRLAKSKEIIFDMVRILSSLSGNVAFMTVDTDRTFYLGLSNVLRSPEFSQDPAKAAQIVEILEGRERFRTMLSSLDIPSGDTKIFIGEENLLEEISSCSMIVSRFQTPDISGCLGILGPMRMRYGFNKALIANVLKML